MVLTAAHAAGKLPIPTNGVYLGVWADPNSAKNQEAAVELLEGPAPTGIGHPFNLHLVYYQWGALAAMLDSNGVFQPDSALAGDISHGRVPVISWNCDPNVAASDHVIAGGDAGEDAIITASAKALAQYPGPVMLRWFWEFNLLANNQICRGDSGGTPTQQVFNDFVGAWQHIWQLFQNAGATNVVFVWNPGNYTEGGRDDPHSFYPGDKYVDWLAIDSYQRAQADTFAVDFGQFYTDFTAAAYGGKPLMVGENAAQTYATYGVENQEPYLKGLLASVLSRQFPLLKAYDYFNASGNSPGSWTLDSNGGIAELAVLAASGAFSPAPILTAGSFANGATYVDGGLVPGSWALIKGVQLSNVTRIWTAADFAGLGNNLPTSLSGVQVTVNNVPAAVYYIDQAQINFQVPSGILGTASVQVINDGAASNTVTAAAVNIAPGLFIDVLNGVYYPAAVFSDGTYVGDPSAGSVYREAKPGDTIALFATGLTTEPGGVIPSVQTLSGVTVTVGSVTVPASYAAQTVYVGEFQINFTLPPQFATMPAGLYPITIQIGGVSSPATVNSTPIVLPIQH